MEFRTRSVERPYSSQIRRRSYATVGKAYEKILVAEPVKPELRNSRASEFFGPTSSTNVIEPNSDNVIESNCNNLVENTNSNVKIKNDAKPPMYPDSLRSRSVSKERNIPKKDISKTPSLPKKQRWSTCRSLFNLPNDSVDKKKEKYNEPYPSSNIIKSKIFSSDSEVFSKNNPPSKPPRGIINNDESNDEITYEGKYHVPESSIYIKDNLPQKSDKTENMLTNLHTSKISLLDEDRDKLPVNNNDETNEPNMKLPSILLEKKKNDQKTQKNLLFSRFMRKSSYKYPYTEHSKESKEKDKASNDDMMSNSEIEFTEKSSKVSEKSAIKNPLKYFRQLVDRKKDKLEKKNQRTKDKTEKLSNEESNN